MLALRTHAAVTSESRALVVGSGSFVVLGVVAFLLVGREPVALSGRGSVGDIAALGTAVLGAAAAVIGSLQRPDLESSQAPAAGRTRNAVDIAALALAHACIFLLGWLALFSIFQRAFVGAVLYPLAGAIIVGTAGAISAYIAYLSTVTMNAYRLAALLAVFLVTAVLTSMLTAENPQWWEENLSALGMSSDVSGVAFNFTLIVAGVVVTTLAGYSTRTLDAAAASSRRRVRLLEGGIVLIGVLLACVGLFPVDQQFWLHTAAASGMVVVFGTLIVRMRSLVPSIPAAFNALGLVFLAVIAFAVVMYFPFGYYNLTAVELIAASLVFAWLIVLIRNLAAVDADHLDAAPQARQESPRTDTGGGPASSPGLERTATEP
ncbi:hypothetical protein WMO79_09865 [Micrococcaceae bacterium Sec7.4]